MTSCDLEKIQEIQDENGVETGIDFESVSNNTLRSCIENSADIEDIFNQFDYLIADLDCWKDDSSEEKQEEINEKYIDVLNEIREIYELDSIEEEDDLINQLDEMINALDDMEI